MRLMWIMLFAALGLAAQTKMPNLALNCPAEASSVENQNLLPEFAVESSAHGNDPQWFKVDLGSVKTVGRVVILWENSAALDYKIQLSSDGENWIDAIRNTDGKGGEETLSFSPQPARFVRFTGQFRIQQYGGYSFREFQVFEK